MQDNQKIAHQNEEKKNRQAFTKACKKERRLPKKASLYPTPLKMIGVGTIWETKRKKYDLGPLNPYNFPNYSYVTQVQLILT